MFLKNKCPFKRPPVKKGVKNPADAASSGSALLPFSPSILPAQPDVNKGGTTRGVSTSAFAHWKRKKNRGGACGQTRGGWYHASRPILSMEALEPAAQPSREVKGPLAAPSRNQDTPVAISKLQALFVYFPSPPFFFFGFEEFFHPQHKSIGKTGMYLARVPERSAVQLHPAVTWRIMPQ